MRCWPGERHGADDAPHPRLTTLEGLLERKRIAGRCRRTPYRRRCTMPPAVAASPRHKPRSAPPRKTSDRYAVSRAGAKTKSALSSGHGGGRTGAGSAATRAMFCSAIQRSGASSNQLGVARFARDLRLGRALQRGQETRRQRRVERQRGRQLDEDYRQLFGQPRHIVDELGQQRVAIGEPLDMGDRLGKLGTEAEIVRHAVAPARPGRGAVAAVEGGIDLDAIEPRRVARKVRRAVAERIAPAPGSPSRRCRCATACGAWGEGEGFEPSRCKAIIARLGSRRALTSAWRGAKKPLVPRRR